jgi:UDP:flavonoid glycosyltransferase YjiC (YdhE family)
VRRIISRVYIAPCGIGLGHVTRSHPIGDELNKLGVETIFSSYLDGLDYARHHGLRVLEAVPISFKVAPDGTIDFKRTAATSGFSLGIRTLLRQTIREIRFIKDFNPDVVFSDSRVSSLVAAWLLRIPVVLMLNQFRIEIIKRPSTKPVSVFDRIFFLIANLGWIFVRTAIQLVWVRSRIILIPDLPPPYTISAGNISIPKKYVDKVRLIGPIVEEGAADRMQEGTKLGQRSGKPLVYAAISGPKIERQVLSRMLLEPLSQLSTECRVILSRGEPDGRPSKQILNGIEVYDWVENQDEILNACDVVISRAGHGIIMKSVAYGKRMVLIPIPDQTEQYGNARRAVSNHFAELIDQNELNAGTLRLAVLKSLASHESDGYRQRMKEAANSMHAASSACQIIVNLIH